jgi:uncharacterized protein YggE
MALDKTALVYLALIILAIGLVVAIAIKPSVVSVMPTSELKTLDVSADGTASADPNLADIFVTVNTKADTADAAQSANADVVNSLRLALIGTGYVKEVTTSSFNVYPDTTYNPTTGASTPNGYRVTHSLKISTEKTATVGKILDVATANGASTVDYVQFSLDDKTVENLKQAALKDAAEKAMAKAQALAAASKVTLGKPVKVSENSYYQPPIYYGNTVMAGASEKSAAPTQVIPGQIEISATVSISYDIS